MPVQDDSTLQHPWQAGDTDVLLLDSEGPAKGQTSTAGWTAPHRRPRHGVQQGGRLGGGVGCGEGIRCRRVAACSTPHRTGPGPNTCLAGFKSRWHLFAATVFMADNLCHFLSETYSKRGL